MKVTFVHLGRENIGVECLSSFLEKVFERKKKIISQILRNKPDLLAFSVYSNTYEWCCDIAKEVKKSLSVKIVFGGIHPTLIPEKVISNDFVDFVVVGEGEHALSELVNNLRTRNPGYQIKNVWYKVNKVVKKNKIRPPIVSLDSLPLPDKSLFENFLRYKDDYIILSSRGCPFSCNYCCESFLNDMYKNCYFRRRSVESVMEELTIMKQRYKFREVMFFDSILFTEKIWLKELSKRFKRKVNVPFRCTGHVNYFDREVAILLKEAGCYCIDFGIQTMDDVTRKHLLGRPETNFQIKKVIPR